MDTKKHYPDQKKNFRPYMPWNFPTWCFQPIWKILFKCYHFHSFPRNRGTLQGTNMSHLGKKNIIFESAGWEKDYVSFPG